MSTMDAEEAWREWVPARAIEELTLRRALEQVEDPVKLANKIFEENLPLVAMGMTHLAVYSQVEAVRLKAQQYVMDRAMGPASFWNQNSDDKTAWEKIFESISVATE